MVVKVVAVAVVVVSEVDVAVVVDVSEVDVVDDRVVVDVSVEEGVVADVEGAVGTDRDKPKQFTRSPASPEACATLNDCSWQFESRPGCAM